MASSPYHLKVHALFMNGSHESKLAYTVEEAAELLSLSRAHLYRLIDLQELGSITIGRSRRITAGQLKAFVDRLEAQAITSFPSPFTRS